MSGPRFTDAPPRIPERMLEMLSDPERRQDGLRMAAQWVTDTCLLFGSEVHTAYRCGAEFARGLEKDLEAKQP